jgi:RNA recognition motif-containing protein
MGITGETCMNIYVGNLSYDVTEADLRAAFEAFGAVASVSIIKDQYSGQPRGFGFVEMPSASEAQAAISGLHGKDLMGRTLNVNEARPREGGSRPERRSGGFGGGPGRRPRV